MAPIRAADAIGSAVQTVDASALRGGVWLTANGTRVATR